MNLNARALVVEAHRAVVKTVLFGAGRGRVFVRCRCGWESRPAYDVQTCWLEHSGHRQDELRAAAR